MIHITCQEYKPPIDSVFNYGTRIIYGDADSFMYNINDITSYNINLSNRYMTKLGLMHQSVRSF